jgi:hypothetical protein
MEMVKCSCPNLVARLKGSSNLLSKIKDDDWRLERVLESSRFGSCSVSQLGGGQMSRGETSFYSLRRKSAYWGVR